MWHFSSDHQTSEGTGKWDPETKYSYLDFCRHREQDFTMTSRHRFVTDDEFEWDVVGNDKNGKILFQLEGKATRIGDSKK